MSEKGRRDFGIIVIALVAGGVYWMWKAYTTPAVYVSPPNRGGGASSAALGDDVHLRKDTFAANTEANYDLLGKSLRASDHVGILNMLESGQAFELSAGTLVKVIGGTITLVEVRVLEGPDVRRSAWMVREAVR